MGLVGFSDESINDTFRTLAAILHLSNVHFIENKRSEGFRIKDRDGLLLILCGPCCCAYSEHK